MRRRSASPAWLLLQRMMRRRLVVVSLQVLVVVAFCAIAGPWIAPYAPQRMDIAHRLAPPSLRHWFGSDDFGRDVLTRCIYGARLSLTVGILVVLVSLVCGTILGVVAGYVRRLDGLLMRVTDALMAFPDILLAIALMSALGASVYDVVVALGTVSTPRVARVARGGTLVLRELQFVEAAEALGATDQRVMRVHLLPNLLSPLLVQGTFIFAASILTEAALSFLGAGVPPTIPSWGNMIAGAQQYMQQAAWLILAPGLCILFTVLSLQMVGDALRDALDPRLRRLT
jgi:peptide/nickel transport system permease protein